MKGALSPQTRVLDILQDYCGMLGYPLERLDGGVTGAARQAAVRPRPGQTGRMWTRAFNTSFSFGCHQSL